ncbi:MAG: hypothetical protein M3Z26_14070 [Bacteroidota bacterium]|nr:hypothetical protein [Bacteroidota bacterium]
MVTQRDWLGQFEDNTKILATKANLAEVKEELKEDIDKVRKLIANTKADIIKLIFIFWVGQIAVTFGFILLFLKK